MPGYVRNITTIIPAGGTVKVPFTGTFISICQNPTGAELILKCYAGRTNDTELLIDVATDLPNMVFYTQEKVGLDNRVPFNYTEIKAHNSISDVPITLFIGDGDVNTGTLISGESPAVPITLFIGDGDINKGTQK